LEFNRPEERQWIPVDDDVPSHFFKAIRLFILQIMRLDIQSFPINRVANNIVIFGVTGKLRLLNRNSIHVILEHIEQMILAQLAHESTPVKKRKRVPNDGANGLDGLDKLKQKVVDVVGRKMQRNGLKLLISRATRKQHQWKEQWRKPRRRIL
jgi:hypothetical protein